MHRQCNNIMPINCWLFGCKALLQQWNQVVSIHSEFLKNRTLHSCYQAFFFSKLNICTYTWFDQSFVHDVVQKLRIEWYRKTKDKIEAFIFNDVNVKFPKNSPSWCLFIENLFCSVAAAAHTSQYKRRGEKRQADRLFFHNQQHLHKTIKGQKMGK